MPKTATPPPPPTDETVAVNVPVPADLHRALKVRAAGEGLTVKDAVIAAIAAWTGT